MNDSMKTEPAEPEISASEIAVSRKKLLMILACFAIPLVLATLWLQIVRMQGSGWGSTSRGELIHPAVPLNEFSLNQFTMKSKGNEPGDAYREPGDAFVLDELRGIWSMVYMPIGDCTEVCQLNLYHMRQVRLALNNRMQRVQRVTLVDSPQQFSDELLAQHLGLRVLSGSLEAVEGLRGQIRMAEKDMTSLLDGIYIVDPLGNVMMRFPPDLDPGKMLKDLKHLLKVSRIG